MFSKDAAVLLPARSIPRKQRLVLEKALATYRARLTGGSFALASASDALLCRTAEAIGASFGHNGVQVHPVSLRALIAAATAEDGAPALSHRHERANPLATRNFGEQWLLRGLMAAANHPPETAAILKKLESSTAWIRLHAQTTAAFKSLFPHHSAAFKIEQRVLQHTLDILRAWLLSARLGAPWRKVALQRTPLVRMLSECVVYNSTLHPQVWQVIVA
ncbi:hypothetical protein EPO33_00410 [Patescibacteria group bacterium]|nr:MAG: hypothetical protein EPO33_00410 [Patescibacteria group bacterium]